MSHVLFVCIQNAGRSQIAQAFFERVPRPQCGRGRRAAARRRTSTPRSSTAMKGVGVTSPAPA